MQTKMVIVVRADLRMTRGKEAAQVAHAALLAYDGGRDHRWSRDWFANSQAKIVVSVDSEAQLREITAACSPANVPVMPVTDAGLTMFKGEPTLTCAAIGPAPCDMIDKVTGHLRLR